MREPLYRGEPHAAAARISFEPELELRGLEIVWVPADTEVLGVIEVVLEDEGLHLVGEAGIVFLWPADGAVTVIGELGDLVVDDGAVAGGVTGVRAGNGRDPLGQQRLVGREPERGGEQHGDLPQGEMLTPLPDDAGCRGSGRRPTGCGRTLRTCV